jgi:hypothetical protein
VSPLPDEDQSRPAAPSPAGGQPSVAPLSPTEQPPVAPLSPTEQPPVAPLSQWLQLMLAEIARKGEELEHSEQAQREFERAPGAAGTGENLPAP